MYKLKSTFKDIMEVMSSHLAILVSGIINGFVIPYVLGVTQYGYYRIFILYASYTDLLHFGFVYGILLTYGGKKYSDLNKKEFRTFTKEFIIFQIIISFLLYIPSLLIFNRFYSNLLLLLSIYTFISNMSTYYMFIFQTIMKFGLFSIISTVQAILSIILTLGICVVYKFKLVKGINYVTFIYVLIFMYLVILLWYMYIFKNITFGSHYSLLKNIKCIFKFCKIGIYLVISYQISNLIMIVDNQFVSLLFKPQTYGRYSFSYSISSRALVILSAISTVLLPHLKKDNFNHMIKVYPIIISYMMIAVYLSLLVYFPITVFMKMLFPQYIQSLAYLKIFLPELGMTCCVTMIIFNYYNALGKSKFYFYMSLIILLMSVFINFGMYLVSYSPVGIAFGSFIALSIWYVASEHFLIKWYKIKWLKNFIYMIIMISCFFLTSMNHDLIIGFIMYLLFYLIITMIMFKTFIKKNLILLLNKIKF